LLTTTMCCPCCFASFWPTKYNTPHTFRLARLISGLSGSCFSIPLRRDPFTFKLPFALGCDTSDCECFSFSFPIGSAPPVILQFIHDLVNHEPEFETLRTIPWSFHLRLVATTEELAALFGAPPFMPSTQSPRRVHGRELGLEHRSFPPQSWDFTTDTY
jgi:hypothetical protein